MKINTWLAFVLLLASCNTETHDNISSNKTKLPIQGTWQLLTGTLIEKKDTTVTNYTSGKKFIKIINDTHFAFFDHDLNKSKDSAAAEFSCGGGTYTLTDSSYTENLEYCNDRQWEGNSFNFIITIKNDTLIQKGIEKVENLGINRINTEKYIRLK